METEYAWKKAQKRQSEQLNCGGENCAINRENHHKNHRSRRCRRIIAVIINNILWKSDEHEQQTKDQQY